MQNYSHFRFDGDNFQYKDIHPNQQKFGSAYDTQSTYC